MLHRIQSSPAATMRTSRRGFLKLVAGTGAGLTLAVNMPAVAADSSATGANSAGNVDVHAFVRITPDDTVVVMIKHLEMGQGTFTGLTTLIAEELDARWDQLQPEHAPVDTARYKNLHWGAQGTGGSSAIANAFTQMRIAGATARAMLIGAAAELWQVARRDISVSQGVVSHTASGRSATFGELATAAANQPIPAQDSLRLKDPADFIYIGKENLRRKDTGKTNGTAVFTQDIQLPGMLVAVVAHPPRFGSEVTGFDASDALKVKGVVNAVQIPSGVAVLAKDTWAAMQGRDALKVEWDHSQAYRGNSTDMMADFRKRSEKSGPVASSRGNTSSVLGQAEKVISSSFQFPYLAHATMEPMNCVALINDTGCELWNGEQLQTIDQAVVAANLGLPADKVKINTLFAGGSFGRRANPNSDYVLEAVQIARQVKGTPVKLVWTREDDTRGGYYRPAYVHRVEAALDADGLPLAWQQRIVGQSIAQGTAFEAFMIKDGIDSTSVEGAANLAYSVPNLRVELHTVKLPVTVQWWRSVGHTHTAFSTEVVIDQLAKAAGKDAVAYRLALLKEHPRHAGALKLVAEKSGWGKPLAKGHYHGVAVHESFNSYVAQVAEIAVHEDGTFTVEKVTCAVDCGVAVNPNIIRAQMEGGIGYGLSAALMSEITLEDGQVQQSNFHDYQVARMRHSPQIEVHIVPSAEAPTGVGEPGTPPIAPAIANALAAATGEWQTVLPLKGARL
ncbi:xanthine dehydrogenase family protein molybdopterin-binding subunit [Marinobacterium jannaschii]|uniref:xanthine dehydrogenase family protein molybdopterin-binding subunit n=1 Tax=Marinobacterium jannaschii TaxID=64970 RepID=UPI0004862DEF|nr:xanthine dehydrogenase family protein molybdopterin-binding subunit [Marinobacterium jannaschii]